MIKAGIDQDALVALFSQASAKQGEAVRKAVSEATLKALQGRELTLTNIKKVLESVTKAASNGAAQSGRWLATSRTNSSRAAPSPSSTRRKASPVSTAC